MPQVLGLGLCLFSCNLSSSQGSFQSLELARRLFFINVFDCERVEASNQVCHTAVDVWRAL